MKLLVISDSHDRKIALGQALKKGKTLGCEAIIFCGDTSSPETFSLLIADGRPVYAVLGNIEHQSEETKRLAQENAAIHFDPNVLTFQIENRSIAVTHYPTAAENLAKKNSYDAVFHGHTHRPHIEYRGRTLIGNPGEISGHITGKRSIGIYDTQANSFEILPLKIN